jgi:MoxR-like ATPase
VSAEVVPDRAGDAGPDGRLTRRPSPVGHAVPSPGLRGTARPDEMRDVLAGVGYLADPALSTAVALAVSLEQPLLLEGEAGVGKTEVARALATALGARLIRLQCHEGIGLHQAVYDWDYQRQLLEIRAAEAGGERRDLYGRDFLVRRPLLEALEQDGPTVLLIDEIDRADDEFEAFLLEFLADFAITIPELGTVAARRPPVVVLTSNRTRELHDALKRRCLYHWIDYPAREREAEIVRTRLPGLPEEIAERVCAAVARLRDEDLYKVPGVGETIMWARALLALDDEADLERTLGVALKVREDIDRVLERGVLDGA